MAQIRKFIEWLKRLINKLFGKNKEKKLVFQNNNSNNFKKNKSQKKVNVFIDVSMPNYMFINDKTKEKLIYSISLMKNMLCDNNTLLRETEFINYLKANYQLDSKMLNTINVFTEGNHKMFDYDLVVPIIKDLSDEANKDIASKYQMLANLDESFRKSVGEIDKIVDLINKSKISCFTENAISKVISDIINDKSINDKLDNCVENFTSNIKNLLGTIDDIIINKTIKEYNTINYVTLSNIIIDLNYEKFKKLEDDYKNHRFNKYYYEREIERIKYELKIIKELKTRKDVCEHILNLRKELFTKSKDKYDLLYNNELFINFDKECDDLLSRINAKVIDVKKEDNKQKELDNNTKRIKNILMRFEDMALARKLILNHQIDNLNNLTKDEIEELINSFYITFTNGIDDKFNFEKNRYKTEYVILYNNINKVITEYQKEPYVLIEHINFRMNDLVEAVQVKNHEMLEILNKNNINCGSSLLDEKINNNQYVLKKDINH